MADIDPAILAAYSTSEPPKPKKPTGMYFGLFDEPDVPESSLTAAPTGGVEPAILAAYDDKDLTAAQRKAVAEWKASQKKEGGRGIIDKIMEGVDIPMGPAGGRAKFGVKPIAQSIGTEDVNLLSLYEGVDVPVPDGKGGWTAKAKVGVKPIAESIRQQTRQFGDELIGPLAEQGTKDVPIPHLLGALLPGDMVDYPSLYGNPTVDVGTGANIASGVPGTTLGSGIDIAGEQVAQELEYAPLTAALGPAAGLIGQGARATGRGIMQGADALGVGKDLRKAGEFFQHRGGFSEGSLEAYGRNDVAEVKAQQMANEVRDALTIAPTGRTYTPEEQRFLGQLLEQPGQREALRSVNEVPVDVSTKATQKFMQAARPVPGVMNTQTGEALRSVGLTEHDLPLVEKALGNPHSVGSILDNLIDSPGFDTPGQGKKLMKEATQNIVTKKIMDAAKRLPDDVKHQIKSGRYNPDTIMGFPVTDVPLKDFARVADDVAQIAGTTGQKLVKAFGKDPTAWSRFTELNYNPRMYAGNRMGTFSTRGLRERTQFFKTREAMTDEARQYKGLVTEPGGPMSLRLLQEQRAINTRNLFTEMAADPKTTYPRALLTDPSDAMMPVGQVRTIDGVEYTMMGDDKSLGPLAGQLVKSQEAADVNALIRRPGALGRTARDWWQGWKFGKTIMSPRTHIRNMAGNAMMAHAEGLSPYRLDIYREALRDVQGGKGVFWKEAKEAGAPWTAGRATSLGDVMQDADLKDAESVYEAWARGLPRFMTKNKASAEMAKAYSDAEGMFKQALYIYKRRNGVPMNEAIAAADRAIINYDKMPNWVKQVRTLPTGIPFISFAYGATPLIVKTMEQNPRIFQHYKLFVDSFNEVAMDSIQATDEERQALQTLYPGDIPMVSPARDAMGKMHVWAAARATPVSQMGDLADPLSYLMANPLVGEAATQLTGYDPFRQQQVFEPESEWARKGASFLGADDPEVIDVLFGEPGRQRRAARGEHALRTFAPTPVSDLMNLIGADGEPNLYGSSFDKGDASVAALYGGTKNVNDDIVRAAMAFKEQKKPAKKAQKKKAMGEDRATR